LIELKKFWMLDKPIVLKTMKKLLNPDNQNTHTDKYEIEYE
jgi:hypothetical protein